MKTRTLALLAALALLSVASLAGALAPAPHAIAPRDLPMAGATRHATGATADPCLECLLEYIQCLLRCGADVTCQEACLVAYLICLQKYGCLPTAPAAALARLDVTSFLHTG